MRSINPRFTYLLTYILRICPNGAKDRRRMNAQFPLFIVPASWLKLQKAVLVVRG